MILLRLPESAWLEIQDAATQFAETFPTGTAPRAKIFKAVNKVRYVTRRYVPAKALGQLAAAAARIVEDDDKPTLVHMRELNRCRSRAVQILGKL